jgi:hypothetical protein
LRERVARVADLDIWRAAGLIIQEHHAAAEIVAARRAKEMLDRGGPERQRVRMPIKRADAAKVLFPG